MSDIARHFQAYSVMPNGITFLRAVHPRFAAANHGNVRSFMHELSGACVLQDCTCARP